MVVACLSLTTAVLLPLCDLTCFSLLSFWTDVVEFVDFPVALSGQDEGFKKLVVLPYGITDQTLYLISKNIYSNYSSVCAVKSQRWFTASQFSTGNLFLKYSPCDVRNNWTISFCFQKIKNHTNPLQVLNLESMKVLIMLFSFAQRKLFPINWNDEYLNEIQRTGLPRCCIFLFLFAKLVVCHVSYWWQQNIQ